MLSCKTGKWFQHQSTTQRFYNETNIKNYRPPVGRCESGLISYPVEVHVYLGTVMERTSVPMGKYEMEKIIVDYNDDWLCWINNRGCYIRLPVQLEASFPLSRNGSPQLHKRFIHEWFNLMLDLICAMVTSWICIATLDTWGWPYHH